MSYKRMQPDKKSLIIGLGGTGKSCLVQLKRLIAEQGYQDTIDQDDVSLLCLDFDPAEYSTTTRTNHSKKVSLETDEMLNLDGDAIQVRLSNMDASDNGHIRDWYPDPNGEIIKLGAHRSGAAQWRPLGRLGFVEHLDKIKPKLLSTVAELVGADSQNPDSYDASREGKAYIVASLGGGTGSSLIWDIAFLLKKECPNFHQVGLFLLPDIFEKYDQGGRLFANTYASLKELVAFANLRRPFYVKYGKDEVINSDNVKEAPLATIFLYNNKLGKLIQTNEIPQMTSLIAETIFWDLDQRGMSQAKDSVDTNIFAAKAQQSLRNSTYQAVFNTSGTVILSLPSRRRVVHYLSQRYISDVLLKELNAEVHAYSDISSDAKPKADISQIKNRPDLFRRLKAEVKRAIGEERKNTWNETFFNEAGGNLATELMKNRQDAKTLEDVIISWLKDFMDPRADGCFSTEPKRLPETDSAFGGNLLKVLNEFKNDLSAKFKAELKDKDGMERVELARDLSAFSASAAQWLKREVSSQRQVLKNKLLDEGADIRTLLSDLILLNESKPIPTAKFDFMAYRHWAIRFMRKIQNHYRDLGLAYRAHILLALQLEEVANKVLGLKIDDHDRDAADVSARLNELENKFKSGDEAYDEPESQRQDLLTRPLANETFWDNLWERLEGDLKKNPITLEKFFSRFANERGEVTLNDLGTIQLWRMTQKLVRGLLKETIEKADQDKSRPGFWELLQYVNSNDMFRETAHARHDYILTNITEHSGIKNHVYATYPDLGSHQAGVEASHQYRRFKGMLTGSLESANIYITPLPIEEVAKTMGVELDNLVPKITIRHVSVNHPACNLNSMETYYRAYTREGEKAGIFHIHRDYLGFDEVALPNQIETYPTCGNPGCTADLSEVSFSEIDCPECKKPILNRCGNSGCNEQELHSYKRMQGDTPSLYCPSCGKYVRTRWWRCERHNRDIARSDAFCKECLKEYQQGEITFDDVQRNESVITSIDCPGCRTLGVTNPARIDFLDVFDQVSFDKFGRAIDIYNNRTKEGKCEKCNSLLLPICPDWDPTKEPEPHFIQRAKASEEAEEIIKEAKACKKPLVDEYRGVGLFICTNGQSHAEECYHECSHCGMPIKEGMNECPRCRIKVDKQSFVEGYNQTIFPEQYHYLDSFKNWIHTKLPMKRQLRYINCWESADNDGPTKEDCWKYDQQKAEPAAASEAPPTKTDMNATEREAAEAGVSPGNIKDLSGQE